MAVFGIFHCAHSAAYTAVTLDSFLRFTPLYPGDEVLVLDNDGDFQFDDARVQVVRTGGRTFAQNVNNVLGRSFGKHTAAFCLNNDLLFTARWREELDQVGSSIAAPLHHHNLRKLLVGATLVPTYFDLEWYRANQATIDQFAASGRSVLPRSIHDKVWLPSFSCFRVSPEVVARLGPLDERFRNGGEDTDYALRAHLKGIDCLVCPSSFVFHFGGKSTYHLDPKAPVSETGSGSFARKPLAERESYMLQTFQSKWGAGLTERFLFRNFVGAEGIDTAHEMVRELLAEAGLQEQLPVCSTPEFQGLDLRQPGQLYLDLLKRCLTNLIYGDPGWVNPAQQTPFDPRRRAVGGDWPMLAHSMIGIKRLDNIQFCLEDVLRRGVPGDVIETGVWRGGATILMRGILKAHGVSDRRVWVADSFEGLPPPNRAKYPQDHLPFHEWRQLAVPLEEVKSNFQKYGLLDSQVMFLKGWFKDTLPSAPIERLAVVRLDGDMYESTMDALMNLYHKLSPGGYLIVDDYRCIEACRQAVSDFRRLQGITDEIHFIDWGGVYWRKA
jgi:hypothetical protein